jgi:hypothetical protein
MLDTLDTDMHTPYLAPCSRVGAPSLSSFKCLLNSDHSKCLKYFKQVSENDKYIMLVYELSVVLSAITYSEKI